MSGLGMVSMLALLEDLQICCTMWHTCVLYSAWCNAKFLCCSHKAHTSVCAATIIMYVACGKL